MEVLKEIENAKIVPVVVIDDEKDALPLAEAMMKGGINIAEITFRTSAAKGAIELISKKCPDMLVGAGTVLTIGQVDEAVKAGAKFIVTPGSNPKVIEYCVKNNIIIIPGCANPSNVELALENGLNVVKFFPAEQAGGIGYIKAISAPYGNVRFMPTGGISPKNVENYLKEKCIIACGGSWMVKKDLIKEGKFDEITKLCNEASELANKYK
ncbi:MAG TPA: 2-dehydro-3-deoxyphosphogluconate aldolase [Lachnospiraceae bacterium]|nr:2-dehydro-3-deoxyphosphogluconate aldolase [Lachnospiraceae bacterium]